MRKLLLIFTLLIGYASATKEPLVEASELNAPVIATIGGADYSTRKSVPFTKRSARIYEHESFGKETDPYTALAWSPDGTQFVAGWSYELEYSGGMRRGEIVSFDQKFKKSARNKEIPLGEVNAMAWHPNGSLAIASKRIDIARIDSEANGLSGDKTFTDWTSWSATLCNPPVHDVAWNTDGTKLAFTLRNAIRIVQPAVQEYNPFSSLMHSIFGIGSQYPQYDSILELDKSAEIVSLSWDPQDRHSLAFGTRDTNPVYIYDTRSKKLLMTVTKERKNCTSVQWSPNGLHLACGSADGSINVLDKRTWKILSALCAGAAIRSLKWSPDSGMVATTAGKDLAIWDATRAVVLKKLQISDAEDAQMLKLAWHSNQNMIAGSNNSGSIRIWDVKNLHTSH